MNRDDIEFRKNCQLYHNEIRRLLRAGKHEDAHLIMRKAEAYLKQWEDYLRSVRFRIGMLKSLLIRSAVEERTVVKRGRKKEEP